MTSSPKLSLITPIYNVETFIHRCLNSMINQTYQNLEIILINDGSTDNSGAICDEYASKYKNIIVLHQKNMGASVARNTGLEVATGDFIGFVDSDDWIHPRKYELLISVAQKENLHVVECDVRYTKKEEEDFQEIGNYNYRMEDRLTALKRVIKNTQFSMWRRIYSREIFDDYRFVVNKNSMDVYFTIDILRKIKKIAFVEEVLYYYYFNPNSITHSAYSLKKLDSVDSGLYLQKTIVANENDAELLQVVNDHILEKLLNHYKRLNYNPLVDPELVHRKKILALIKKNYNGSKNHHLFLKLAYHMPIKIYHKLLQANVLRHKIFKIPF